MLSNVQVCLQAAASVAKELMGSVMYLDTCNSFSPQRIARFVDLVPNLSFDHVTVLFFLFIIRV